MGVFRAHGGCGRGDGQSGLTLAPTATPCHIGAETTKGACPVTNRIAMFLIVLICAALLIDVIFYGTDHLKFLFRKMIELLEWLAFWR